MTSSKIHLFGPPVFIIEGEDCLADLPLKGLALLGYLAMEGGAHRRDTLAALLWPDTEESRRRGNLRTLLYELNRLAPALLEVDRQTVRLTDAGEHAIDVARARRLLASGTPEDHLAAADDLRGPFLPDLFLDDADTFESWLTVARSYWENQGQALLESAAEVRLLDGEPEAARELFEGLLRFQPWHEPSQRALMRLHAAAGDYVRALQRYEQLLGILDREFGIEPEAETSALRDRIAEARGRPSWPVPAQPTGFIGREAETVRIRELLAGRKHRLVTILGPGGNGKTRLALHLAAEAGYLFLDGIVFVPLAGLRSDESVLTIIAQALEVPGIKAGEVQPALFSYLKNRELLLILDNFEHLSGQAERLAEMLAACGGVQLLLTSREPVGIRWETVYRLDGLPYAEEGDDPSGNYPAAQLFAAAARRADAGFEPDPHWEAISRVCRAVAGAPLAIELAGALAAVESPVTVADRVEESLELLQTGLKDVPERQRSMQAVFDYSWLLLSEEEQDQLGRLSVFQGGFTPAAARTVTGCTRSILERLVGKSLLAGLEERFDFHPLVQQFAGKKISPDVAVQIAAKHAEFYSDEMAGVVSQMVGFSQTGMIRRIRLDYGNFTAAFDWGLAHEAAGLVPLVEGLTRYFDLLSLFKDGLALMARAEAALVESEGAILGDIRASRARFENKQNRYNQAITLAKQVAEDESLRERTRAAAYLEWGWALWHTGEFADAEVPLAAGRDLALVAEDGFLLAHLLRNQGIVAWYQSQFEDAHTFTQEAFAYHKEIGDLQGMADALNNLALVTGDLGDYVASLGYLNEALEIKRELGDVNGQAIALGNLGTLYAFLGMFAEAEAALESGIDLSVKVGNRENAGHSGINRAGLSNLMGHYKEALSEAAAALKQIRGTGDTWSEAYGLEFLGLAHEGLGNLGEAEAAFRQALEIRREVGVAEIIYHSLSRLAWNLMQQGSGEDAVEIVVEMDGLVDAGAVQNVRIFQSGLWNTFRVLDAVGDERAKGYLERAAALLREQADKIINPELRRSFLENVPEHIAIRAAMG